MITCLLALSCVLFIAYFLFCWAEVCVVFRLGGWLLIGAWCFVDFWWLTLDILFILLRLKVSRVWVFGLISLWFCFWFGYLEVVEMFGFCFAGLLFQLLMFIWLFISVCGYLCLCLVLLVIWYFLLRLVCGFWYVDLVLCVLLNCFLLIFWCCLLFVLHVCFCC